MSDEVREELATLGQHLVLVEVQRQDAIDRVRALVRQHRTSLSTADASRWTTLPRHVLDAMLGDE